MLLGERLCHDLYRAMQQGNKVRVSTLRLLSVALKNCEIANGAALEEHEAVEVVIGATKQRRETIRLAREYGREDIAQQEENELAILETDLPERLDVEEVRRRIDMLVQELNIASPKDVGRLMKILMPTLQGQVDESIVSRLVRERLEWGK